MRHFGRKHKKWLKFRKKWLKNHPPNHQGYYICYIPWCGKWIKANEMTLDHVESRSRSVDRVFDESNLRTCCIDCNQSKGSLSLEQFQKKVERE